MVAECTWCEIKGRERFVGKYSLEECKSKCLENDDCKGIDWGRLPPNMNKCYFALNDVNEIGTTWSVTYRSFKRQTC